MRFFFYKTVNSITVLLPFNLQYLLVLGSCVGSSLVRTLGGGWNRHEDNAAIMKQIKLFNIEKEKNSFCTSLEEIAQM